MSKVLFIQDGMELKLYKNSKLPAKYSSDVPCEIRVSEEYKGYIVTGMYQGEFEDTPHYFEVNSDGSFKLPAGFFKYSDGVYLSFAIMKDNEIISLIPLLLDIKVGLDFSNVIPEGDETWIEIVERKIDEVLSDKIDAEIPELVDNLIKQYGIDIENLINDNLLTNSDFRKPINQRGKTEYTSTDSNVYTVDRWRIWNCNLEVLNDRVRISNTAGNNNGLFQKFESYMPSGNYTISAKIENLTGSGKLVIRDHQMVLDSIDLANGVISFSVNGTFDNVGILSLAACQYDVIWIKLEQGVKVTDMIPQNNAVEIQKCFRYCEEGLYVAIPCYIYAENDVMYWCNLKNKKPRNDGTITISDVSAYSSVGGSAEWVNTNDILGKEDMFRFRCKFKNNLNKAYSCTVKVIADYELYD